MCFEDQEGLCETGKSLRLQYQETVYVVENLSWQYSKGTVSTTATNSRLVHISLRSLLRLTESIRYVGLACDFASALGRYKSSATSPGLVSTARASPAAYASQHGSIRTSVVKSGILTVPGLYPNSRQFQSAATIHEVCKIFAEAVRTCVHGFNPNNIPLSHANLNLQHRGAKQLPRRYAQRTQHTRHSSC